MRILTLVVLSMGIARPLYSAAVETDGLDKPLANYKEGRAENGLKFFCTKAVKMPCGQELLPASEKATNEPPILLDLKDTTPREVLNKLVGQLADSRWEMRSGVINIEPRKYDGDDLLGTKLPEFSAHGVSSLQAALDLFEDAGITVSYEEMGRRRHFGVIDVDLKKTTVREGLNAIVKADGELMWVFTRSNNPESQSKGTLFFFSPRTAGKTFPEEWKKTKRWKREHGGEQSKQ